jgi:hypothetical protein
LAEKGISFGSVIGLPAKWRYGLFFVYLYFGKFFFFLNFTQKKLNIGHSSFVTVQGFKGSGFKG